MTGIALVPGLQLGRLTIIRVFKAEKTLRCAVSCACGAQKTVRAHQVLSGKTRSCGCLRSEQLVARSRSHGNAPIAGLSATYQSWRGMKARCVQSTHSGFKYYGGRGIVVCDRWHSFENFLTDMGERPAGRTLDRVDRDGNYEPENCRWATPAEQTRNSRKAKLTDATSRAVAYSMGRAEDIATIYDITPGHVRRLRRNARVANSQENR